MLGNKIHIKIEQRTHKNELLDCYVPYFFDGHHPMPALDNGSYILKETYNRYVDCKKCSGSGNLTYLDSISMELVVKQDQKCQECKGYGQRKAPGLDQYKLAEQFANNAYDEYHKAKELINRYKL